MTTAIAIHPTAYAQVGFSAPSGILKFAAASRALVPLERNIFDVYDFEKDAGFWDTAFKGLRAGLGGTARAGVTALGGVTSGVGHTIGAAGRLAGKTGIKGTSGLAKTLGGVGKDFVGAGRAVQSFAPRVSAGRAMNVVSGKAREGVGKVLGKAMKGPQLDAFRGMKPTELASQPFMARKMHAISERGRSMQNLAEIQKQTGRMGTLGGEPTKGTMKNLQGRIDSASQYYGPGKGTQLEANLSKAHQTRGAVEYASGQAPTAQKFVGDPYGSKLQLNRTQTIAPQPAPSSAAAPSSNARVVQQAPASRPVRRPGGELRERPHPRVNQADMTPAESGQWTPEGWTSGSSSKSPTQAARAYGPPRSASGIAPGAGNPTGHVRGIQSTPPAPTQSGGFRSNQPSTGSEGFVPKSPTWSGPAVRPDPRAVPEVRQHPGLVSDKRHFGDFERIPTEGNTAAMRAYGPSGRTQMADFGPIDGGPAPWRAEVKAQRAAAAQAAPPGRAARGRAPQQPAQQPASQVASAPASPQPAPSGTQAVPSGQRPATATQPSGQQASVQAAPPSAPAPAREVPMGQRPAGYEHHQAAEPIPQRRGDQTQAVDPAEQAALLKADQEAAQAAGQSGGVGEWLGKPLYEGAPQWATRGTAAAAGGAYLLANRGNNGGGGGSRVVIASASPNTGRVNMEKRAFNPRLLAALGGAGLGGAGLGALLAGKIQANRYEPSRMPLGGGAVYGPNYALEDFADEAGDADGPDALQEALRELQESGAVYDPYDEMVYKGASDRGAQRARTFIDELSKIAAATLNVLREEGVVSPQVAAEFNKRAGLDVTKLAGVFTAFGAASAIADAQDPT